MKSLSKQFKEFMEIYCPAASPNQAFDMQICFYAGAEALQFGIMDSISDGDEVKDEYTDIMQDVTLEMITFASTIQDRHKTATLFNWEEAKKNVPQ